jgi:hypothetical protein
MLPDLNLLSTKDVKTLFLVQLREVKEAANRKLTADELNAAEFTLHQLSAELQSRKENDLWNKLQLPKN